MAALGKHPSNDLSPQGGSEVEEEVGDPRAAKLLFLHCKQGLQIKAPVLVMLSAGKASSSSKEVKSGLEKSSHLTSYI